MQYTLNFDSSQVSYAASYRVVSYGHVKVAPLHKIYCSVNIHSDELANTPTNKHSIKVALIAKLL